MTIDVAETDAEIEACYPVMRELRPHLVADTFVATVRGLQKDGYMLAFGLEAGRIVVVAGFRIKKTLFCARFLYVDDLVTASTERSKGHGRIMLEWLESRAREDGCAELRLDSGMHRKDAHRFYEHNGVAIDGYHFRVVLNRHEDAGSGEETKR
jgi:GNAT superfamily N-acetyltransferase